MKNLYRLQRIFDDPRFEGFAFGRDNDERDLPSLLGRESLKDDLDPTPEIERGLPIIPLKDKWQPPEVCGRVRPFNDFPTVYPYPAFSQRAVDALEDLLDGNGELLPLASDVGDYFLFHVTRLADIVDVEKSDIVFEVEHPIIALTIEHFVLKDDTHPESSIFRIPQLPRETYVTDELVDRVIERELQGFRFYRAWPVEKGTSWRRTPVDFAGAAEEKRTKNALKANTIVLLLRMKGDEPSLAEKKRLDKIQGQLDDLLKVDSTEDEDFLGSFEGYDEVDGSIRMFISCPNAQRLATILRPWRDNLKWWPTRVEMVLGDYDFREAPPEIIPKMFHDE